MGLRGTVSVIGVALAVAAVLQRASGPPEAKSLRVIVQATDVAAAGRAVRSAGGTITHNLSIINAVGARLAAAQAERLLRSPEVRRLYANHDVQLADESWSDGGSAKERETFYPTLVGADRLHREGIDGRGVTVAVVDTGLWGGNVAEPWLAENVYGAPRVLARYDAVGDFACLVPTDPSGHGTHVTSIIASSRYNGESYNSIAPNANIVVVTAFDTRGSGTYLDVIQGIDRIVRYKDVYKIRVLNLSFSAAPRSQYWDDPLNQAVMRAWQAGMVVVVSGGNTGPNPMTVGVPGNVPYVITVGAMTDNYTPDLATDDALASFSSTGPTVEGFVKPELVAPGGHMLGLMDKESRLAIGHAEFHDRGAYFMMSGTSQAAAVVSGIAALMLQKEPWLSPDEVKCRLIASARPALDSTGSRAYTIFQQGAGLVDAYAAVHGTTSGCANGGMDINLDLAGLVHYGGPANRDASGNYYLMGLNGDGYVWNGGYSSTSAYLWSTAYLWPDSYLWANGHLWSDAYLWSNAYLWSSAYLWSAGLTERMAINKWVGQE